MTNELCRRCPLHSQGGAGFHGRARESVYADAPLYSSFKVAVAAGSPRTLRSSWAPDDPASDLDWENALVALATAVVERGGTVAVPANIEVAHLLSLTAYTHAAPTSTRAPVQVFETGGYSAAARRLLAPLVRRNALNYHGADGFLVPATKFLPPGEHDARLLSEQEHHPLAGRLLDDALGVVVIHPDDRMIDELFDLRTRGSSLAIFGATGLAHDVVPWAREHDPVRRLLQPFTDPEALTHSPPYGVVMELLVDEWLSSPAWSDRAWR